MDIIRVGRKNQGKELGGGAVWCDCPSDANRGRSGFYCKGKPLVNGQNCCERNVMKVCYIGKKTQMGGRGKLRAKKRGGYSNFLGTNVSTFQVLGWSLGVFVILIVVSKGIKKQKVKVAYRIKAHTKRQAKKLGVEVKPSKVKGKKIDVFKNGKKIVSVGAIGYNDYPTYIQKKGKKYANERRKLYKQRHQQNRKVRGSAGYYADKLLW